jgi:hypothetical protein
MKSGLLLMQRTFLALNIKNPLDKGLFLNVMALIRRNKFP